MKSLELSYRASHRNQHHLLTKQDIRVGRDYAPRPGTGIPTPPPLFMQTVYHAAVTSRRKYRTEHLPEVIINKVVIHSLTPLDRSQPDPARPR